MLFYLHYCYRLFILRTTHNEDEDDDEAFFTKFGSNSEKIAWFFFVFKPKRFFDFAVTLHAYIL